MATVLALGCGGKSPPDEPDAAVPDAAVPDAAVLDAPQDGSSTSDAVQLVVELDGVPEVGIDVVYQSADGSVVEHVRTDSDGVARSTAVGVAMATVLRVPTEREEQPTRTLFTYGGLQPGDEVLHALRSAPQVAGRPIDLTAPGAHEGAASYLFTEGCSISFGSVLEDLVAAPAPACATAEGRWSYLGVARSEAGRILAYSHLIDQAAMPTATPTLSDWSDPIDVTFNVASAPTFTTASLAPIPTWESIRYPVGAVAPTDESELEFEAGFPRAFGEEQTYDIRLVVTTASFNSTVAVADRVPADTRRIDLTFTEAFLPVLRTSTFDRAVRTFAWTRDSGGAPADLVRVQVSDIERFSWVMVTAPDTTTVVLPQLPASLSDWDVPSEGLLHTVALIDSGAHDGWIEARLDGLALSERDAPIPARVSSVAPYTGGPLL